MSDFFVTPWTVTCQAPLSVGFPRQEYWSRLPFPSPGDLLHPGIRPVSLALQVDVLPWSHQGNPSMLILVTTEWFHRFVSKTSWKWHLLVRASLDRRSIVISARKATESWECSQFQTKMEKLTHLVSILEQLDHGLCTWPSQAKAICMVDTDSNIPPSLWASRQRCRPLLFWVSPLTNVAIIRSIRGISKHMFFLSYTCDFPKVLWDIE